MPLVGDTLVRLQDGSDVPISSLVNLKSDALVFGCQEPWIPVGIGGTIMPGLVVGVRARGAKITRRNEPIVTLTFKERHFPKKAQQFGKTEDDGSIVATPTVVMTTLRCGATQLLLMLSGSYKAAGLIQPGERLRPLVTDILPGTNGDIQPLIDIAGRISTVSLKFPEVEVESNVMSDTADMWDLAVPAGGNFGLTAKVFAYGLCGQAVGQTMY